MFAILGMNMIELFFFVLIFGFATGRLTRLAINEPAFAFTGTIFRYLMGMRYERVISDEKLIESELSVEEYPQTPSFIMTLIMAKDNDLGAYQLKGTNYLSDIVSCPFCMGYWIAVLSTFSFLIINVPAGSVTLEDIWWGLWISSAVAQVGIMTFRKT
jgi:hypothetical protein